MTRSFLLLFCFFLSHQTLAADIFENLDGLLYFHRYSSYDSWDAELWCYDFSAKTLQCISSEWEIDHEMNVRLSSDGSEMLFMGVEKGQHTSAAWDVFLWRVGSKTHPENLTRGNGLRDEDPFWSPTKREFAFKQNGRVKIMNLANRSIESLFEHDGNEEQSMPVFIPDSDSVVFMQGAGRTGDLFIVQRTSNSVTLIAGAHEVQEYFPVPWSTSRLLYTRWVDASNHNDQLYCYSLTTGESYRLPFCISTANFSDACPVSQKSIIFSSTLSSGEGGYDLYLGNSLNGEMKSLSDFGINSKLEELGAVYVPRAK